MIKFLYCSDFMFIDFYVFIMYCVKGQCFTGNDDVMMLRQSPRPMDELLSDASYAFL